MISTAVFAHTSGDDANASSSRYVIDDDWIGEDADGCSESAAEVTIHDTAGSDPLRTSAAKRSTRVPGSLR